MRLTALEGLRLLGYYAYQTDNQDHRWRRGGLGAIVDATRDALISALPGMNDLPWVWSRADLDARRVEPAEAVAPDPRIAEFAQRYADAGIALKQWGPPVLPFRIGHDLPVLAAWSYHPPGYTGTPAIWVFLAGDDPTAELLVKMVRSRFEGIRANRAQGMIRRGHEVVAFDWLSWEGTYRGEDLWESVTAIAPVDERWHSSDPPEYEGRGEVLARRVEVHPDRLSNGGAFFVARTPKDLAALADEIADPDVRDRILRIDTRRQSVIALPKTARHRVGLRGPVRRHRRRHAGLPLAQDAVDQHRGRRTSAHVRDRRRSAAPRAAARHDRRAGRLVRRERQGRPGRALRRSPLSSSESGAVQPSRQSPFTLTI